MPLIRLNLRLMKFFFNYNSTILVKGSPISKALTVQSKVAFFPKRLILLSILLYGQFIHHTQINLRPNKQLLSTQQHLISHFWLLSGLIQFASL